MNVESKCPQLRISRPTSNFDAILKFYQTGLGFKLLGEFKDHNGFDGMMLGHAQWPFHFEFTIHHTSPVKPMPTEEDLIVFYVSERDDWKMTVDRLEECGFVAVKSYNPYWDKSGKTFADPDGYRVVLQNTEWA